MELNTPLTSAYVFYFSTVNVKQFSTFKFPNHRANLTTTESHLLIMDARIARFFLKNPLSPFSELIIMGNLSAQRRIIAALEVVSSFSSSIPPNFVVIVVDITFNYGQTRNEPGNGRVVVFATIRARSLIISHVRVPLTPCSFRQL